MRRVERNEILDFVTYEERRPELRRAAMAAKDARRAHAGGVLTFLFENRETVRYQIQEMVRIERMVREADIQHEIDTYNELLGGPGALGCTLLIEIDDAAARPAKLAELLHAPEHVYVRVADGTKVYARPDPRQSDGERVSSVQYLEFDVRGRAPIAVGCDDPALTVETALTEAQQQALREDLQG